MLTVLHLRNSRGECYRKTLQYGFCLQEAVDAMYSRPKPHRRKPAWLEQQLTEECRADMYACGFLPARYPLPVL